MVMEAAPGRPISSSSGENPPAVPWPPHIGMEPAAMPSSASCPSPRAMPTERRFCTTISPATSRIISSSERPPFFRTLRSHWKPTDVKKATMQRSRTVPSNMHSTPPKAYRQRVSSEISRPPDTGAGMQ